MLFLIAVAAELALPSVMANFIDLALGGAVMAQLIRLAAIFLSISILGQFMRIAESYLATDLGMRATNQLRADLADHCLRLDMHFHNARTPGELIERVDGDVGVLNTFFSRFVIGLLGNVALLIGVLILLTGIDWRIGASIAAFTVITLLLLNRISNIGVPYWTAGKEARATYFGFIEERLSGTEDIRANGAVPYTMKRLLERARVAFRKDLLAGFVSTSSFSLVMVLFWIGTAIALGFSASLFVQGRITIGTAYLIFGYTQLLYRPIRDIVREIDEFQEAGASLRRVDELLDIKSNLTNGQAEPPVGAFEVTFDRVSFSYAHGEALAAGLAQNEQHAAETAVLQQVSFQLEAGKKLGLLGRTGSGKSTLARLLLRFYDPQTGQVRVSAAAGAGRNLSDLDLQKWRSSVGMVTQEVQLFNATLRDNLTFFNPSIPDGNLRHALSELGLLEWINSFDHGLDTLIKAGGEGLSAGESQLLAFARVFLKDPGLVILDEASSRLDPQTERHLEQAVSRLLLNRTAIIIAHRLTTIRRTDKILILDKGIIRELGDRTALEADPESHFSRLLASGMEAELV
jgi:ATP-binding cassette subfamily B protein